MDAHRAEARVQEASAFTLSAVLSGSSLYKLGQGREEWPLDFWIASGWASIAHDLALDMIEFIIPAWVQAGRQLSG